MKRSTKIMIGAFLSVSLIGYLFDKMDLAHWILMILAPLVMFGVYSTYEIISNILKLKPYPQ
jgi:uncharacterized membrane protein